MLTVAALYIDRLGPYPRLPGVDAWDVDRDARRYPGPHPIVAHPPCGPWGRLRHRCIRQDRTLAPLAVEQLAVYGGVLEHPSSSTLWDHLDLPKPGRPARCVYGRPMWSLEVEQVRWGHPAVKRTWLLFAGVGDEDLPPHPPVAGADPRVQPEQAGERVAQGPGDEGVQPHHAPPNPGRLRGLARRGRALWGEPMTPGLRWQWGVGDEPSPDLWPPRYSTLYLWVGEHCVWTGNTRPTCEAWGRWCALQVSHLWGCPNVVRLYLETGDRSLRDRACRLSASSGAVPSRWPQWSAWQACVGGLTGSLLAASAAADALMGEHDTRCLPHPEHKVRLRRDLLRLALPRHLWPLADHPAHEPVLCDALLEASRCR